MSKRYQYVAIGGQYYCLQQSPVALAWFLYFKNKSLRSRSGFRKRKVLWKVKALIEHQLHLRKDGTILELPAYGNLCLKVHRGYRIFNYGQNTVVRIINPDVDPAVVVSEIEMARKASLLDFAPSVRRWNIKERWYEEDFVIGYLDYSASKLGSAALLKAYHQDIAPCIECMILLQAPLSTNLGEYVNKAMDILEDGRLSKQGLDVRKIGTTRSFVESMAKRLCLEGDCKIDLVFSHGDFSMCNILRTKNGIKVIDWEGAGYRNILFDLYNYFFTELYYKRATTNLVSEINEAISSLQSSLTSKAPDIARTLPSLTWLYRRLYYFERVLMLLERDLSNHILDVILRSIEVFNRYEEVVTNDRSA